MQDRRRVDRRGRGIHLDHVSESVEQGPGDLDPDAGSVRLADVGERPLDLATAMPRDPVRGLRCTQLPLLWRHGIDERVESLPQPFCVENLVEAKRQLLHGSDC